MPKFLELNNRAGIPTLINIAEIMLAKENGSTEVVIWLNAEPLQSLIFVISYKELKMRLALAVRGLDD